MTNEELKAACRLVIEHHVKADLPYTIAVATLERIEREEQAHKAFHAQDWWERAKEGVE